jgi:tripartite-type tricarboxylate transporter receptor subunit TctC
MKAHSASMQSPLARRVALACVAAVMSFSTLSVSRAQSPETWPSKPVKIVVPFTAGGGTDIVARLVAEALRPQLGQPIIIENRFGAAGGIGTQFVARAPADGYTVLHGTIGTHSVNQYLFGNLQYDPVKDFAPVALLSKTNYVITVPAGSPFRSLAELMKHATQNPGKLNYGIANLGDAGHLGFEMLKHDAKLPMVGIPYNSVPTTMNDLVAGRLDVVTAGIQSVIELISAGKLRALAVTGDSRSPSLPEVPTIAESGFPGFAASGWQGYFVPAGTHPLIVKKLETAVAKAYQQPELIAKTKSFGIELAFMPPDQFAAFVAADRAKWSKVIRDADIKVQ